MCRTFFLSLFIGLMPTIVFALDCKPITSRFAVDGSDFVKSSYEVRMQSCVLTENTESVVSLRRFQLKNKIYRWFVNSETLKTGLVPESCLTSCENFNSSNDESNYSNLLVRSSVIPSSMANAGLIGANKPAHPEVYLTVDLCPSSKELQKELFEKIQMGGMQNIPVALAVSGLWIKRHTEEFHYLLSLSDQKKINITWVNHSLTHPYKKDVPLEENFLLIAGLDFAREVLGNEQVMLSQGLVPSIFFRFPGLISSDQLIKQLKEWGLITLGSNAWLGNGQKIKNGSIILVHGNGNELTGLQLLYKALEIHPEINTSWMDLNQIYNSVTDTASDKYN